jgi:hypothetical protein
MYAVCGLGLVARRVEVEAAALDLRATVLRGHVLGVRDFLGRVLGADDDANRE